MQEWVERMLSGIVGAATVLVPLLFKWAKDRRSEDRVDYRTLLSDIRRERAEVKKEFDALRDEHEECIRRAVKQEQQITYLNERIDSQSKKIDALQREITQLKQR